MAYNEIDINGTKIKGHKGLGANGETFSVLVSTSTLNQEITAPDDGWCQAYTNQTAGNYILTLNGQNFAFFGSNLYDSNQYRMVGFPVCKGAKLKMTGSGGTLHGFQISVYKYS